MILSVSLHTQPAWPSLILQAYQLAQSVLKVGSALAEMLGGPTALADSEW